MLETPKPPMYDLRLPLFLAIYAIGWGLASSSPRVLAVSPAPQTVIVAQTPATKSTQPSVVNASPAYDRQMQAGYRATGEKDYQKALEAFQNALKERPNDIYAQQAIHNIEAYLARQINPLWLLLGLLAILGGLGLAFWLLWRRLSATKVPQKSTRSDVLLESETLPETETAIAQKRLKSEHSANDQNGLADGATDAAADSLLPLQQTTRLPNLDPIAQLIGDLRESDPKKRRKAIWELAQKADSRAMKPLVDLMIDTDSQERSLILEALSQISGRTLKPMNQALAISLQDKNPQVRKNAMRDLTRIYDLMSQISQLLCHAIDDADLDVQETAKWALNQINLQMPPRLDLISRQPQEPSVTVEQSYSESGEDN